ncbi:olfactory receptor 52E8-like [Bombina bombina]|uniref:olfactory receptor 52E8-like n=1 Tax=Bombina bombina TaxID=8345 RepID=UPI00235A9137|nr:olfactory receptor 52E8-like [Bombina bombina]
MKERSTNQSHPFSHTEFVLLGFPGTASHRPFLVIPFLAIYLVILTANFLIIYRIWAEKSLHSPMYSLISVLLLVNLFSSTAILPKFLLGLLFDLNQITLSGCLLQMFTIYFMVTYESAVVLLMALDRYVAICRPLRYHDIMTNRLLAQLSFIAIMRSICLVLPLILLASQVQYCKSNIILNFVCENMGLLNLGCGNISTSLVAGLIIRILVTVADLSFLLVSYSNILNTAMKIVVGKAKHKALHTCGTHLSVAITFHMSALSSSIVYRIQSSISIDIQNLFSAIYLIIPAALNPLIYGFGVREIRKCLVKAWRKNL